MGLATAAVVQTRAYGLAAEACHAASCSPFSFAQAAASSTLAGISMGKDNKETRPKIRDEVRTECITFGTLRMHADHAEQGYHLPNKSKL